MNRPALLWGAIVVPVWVVLALCAHWEPIVGDGWGHYQWHREFALTLANVWTFARETYLYNNPRLGQVWTLLVYTPGPYHVIATPIIELLLFWILTVIALGRLPRLSSSRDALTYVTVTAMVIMAFPQIGLMLFYRPFMGNYLFGFVLCGLLLIPYRIHAETPTARPWWWILAMFLLGGCAGIANEHTGPALAAMIAIAIVWFVRRGKGISPWMIAGLAGLIVGGLALYYAPGQALRYNGLANRSMVDRIADRTLQQTLRVVLSWLTYTRFLVPWLLLGGWARWLARRDAIDPNAPTSQRAATWAVVVGACLIAVTLLASPKQGPRLYFAPIALVCAALAGAVVPWIRHRATHAGAWLLGVAALGYAGVCLLTTYHTVGSEFANRLHAIQHGAAQSVVTIVPYSLNRPRWFTGEDFGAESIRNSVAFGHGLARIELQRPAAKTGE